MRLVIVRHGEAVPAQVDPDRPLSPRGVQQAQAVGRRLAELGVEVAEIWHSSKLRAQQTAQEIADALGAEPAPQQRQGLKPNDPVEPIADALAEHEGDLMLVGHLPFVQDLTEILLDTAAVTPSFPECGTVLLRRSAAGAWALEQQLVP